VKLLVVLAGFFFAQKNFSGSLGFALGGAEWYLALRGDSNVRIAGNLLTLIGNYGMFSLEMHRHCNLWLFCLSDSKKKAICIGGLLCAGQEPL